MLGLALTESGSVGYWKKSGLQAGEYEEEYSVRGFVVFLFLLQFFCHMCAVFAVFLSCHRCPRWLRRVWDMSGIPFTRSLAVRHRNSVTLWRPLLTCRFVCLRSLTWCICVLLFVCLFFLLFVCLLSLTCCICRRCSRYRGCSVFVCLSFFCLFVCYHSRAINVESVLRLEMLDPSLSSEADRRPVEVGATEFLNVASLCKRN